MELDGRLSDKEKSELNDSKIAIQSVFEGMARFYLYNQPMLRVDCPRLQLMHRIGCCLEIALENNGIADLYAADLIHINERTASKPEPAGNGFFPEASAGSETAVCNVRRGSVPIQDRSRHPFKTEQLPPDLAGPAESSGAGTGTVFRSLFGPGTLSGTRSASGLRSRSETDRMVNVRRAERFPRTYFTDRYGWVRSAAEINPAGRAPGKSEDAP